MVPSIPVAALPSPLPTLPRDVKELGGFAVVALNQDVLHLQRAPRMAKAAAWTLLAILTGVGGAALLAVGPLLGSTWAAVVLGVSLLAWAFVSMRNAMPHAMPARLIIHPTAVSGLANAAGPLTLAKEDVRRVQLQWVPRKQGVDLRLQVVGVHNGIPVELEGPSLRAGVGQEDAALQQLLPVAGELVARLGVPLETLRAPSQR